MAQVAADLTAWLAIAEEEPSSEPNRSEAMERLRRALGPRIERDDRVARLRARFDELLGLSNELFLPLERELTEYGEPEAAYYDDTTERVLGVGKFLYNRTPIEQRSPCLRLIGPGSPKVLVLGIGRYIALTDDDDICVGGALYLQLEVGNSKANPDGERIGMFVAPAESIEAEQNVRRVVRGMNDHVESWVQRFVSELGT